MHWFIIIILIINPLIVAAKTPIVVKGLFKDMAIVTINGKQRVLKPGKINPEGATLITADSNKAVIEYKGQRNTYRLGQHISGRYKPPPRKSQVMISPDNLGMYRTGGSINGFSVKFLVDTGATLIAMNETEAKRMGLDYKFSGVPGQATTASGVTKAWFITLKIVKVGSLTLEKVEAAVIKGQYPEVILLGNSFLNRLQMNRKGRLMELSTR